MREEESNWFSRWEEELPSPDELTPLSQTLITPDLALAFDIRNPQQASPAAAAAQAQPDFADSGEVGFGSGDEPARTLKRPRLVWTPQLHKRFVDAVAHLGIKNAVPKTIMQLMSVDGLTRENVASHLQKYRLYLKRMQGLSGGGGGGPPGPSDPATDHLFASSPVPPHFLHAAARASSDHYMPFVPVTALHHQQQQMGQYHRQVGQFEHPFLATRQPLQRMVPPLHNPVPSYAPADDLDSANADGGRKVLTLFPTGDD